MASPESSTPNGPKYSAPKDKSCPYCGQAFTSSSLGRHLDLYIKDKNPKPQDGLHNVDEIKRMRGNITRRQPRNSLPHRESSTPISTPRLGSRKQSMNQENPFRVPKEGQYAVDTAMNKFSQPRWETASGISDSVSRDGEGDAVRRTGAQRSVSRQVAHKAQYDAKQKLADAMDTARAAELALRELLGSCRAAQQQIDANSMPFDFDPLSLDFPTLTLQCLQPPPTLYSSTQHPTSTSWSVQSPGRRELEALRSHFREHFRAWKSSCVSATAGALEDHTHPSTSNLHRDRKEMVRKVEKSAENMEKQVNEHLHSAYTVWESLPSQRQTEIWVLELARGVGRKHKEAEKTKKEQEKLQQENARLKAQVERLSQSQQSHEVTVVPPITTPTDKDLLKRTYEQVLNSQTGIGFNLGDRHLDLASLVTKSIERWKTVVVSTRASSGMAQQRSLGGQSNVHLMEMSGSHSNPPSQAPTPVQNHSAHQPPKRASTASTSAAQSEQTAPSTTNTGPPSIDENSDMDQDADAEMEDDDSFAMMSHAQPSPVKPTPAPVQQQQQTLDVSRTRPMHRAPAPDPRFLMANGAANSVTRAAINMTRSMPNMNLVMQNNGMHGGDITMAMQGNPMYME